jgi:small subunit ribosomal protein S6
MSKTSASETQEGAKKYELMIIVNPDIGELGAKNRLNEIKKMITAEAGEIFYEDVWGIRDMSYAIKKHRQGWYAVLDFIVDPEKIKEMNDTMRIDPELLRHMITALPFSYQPKSFAVLPEPEVYKFDKDGKRIREEAKPQIRKDEPVKKVEETETAKPKAVKEQEPAEETKPAKKEEVKSTSLEDVDAKLRSIIDNPDINF